MHHSSSTEGSGWGLVALAVFKTAVTSHRAVWWVRFPRALAIFVIVAALSLGVATPASAQRTAAARAGIGDTIPDSLRRPPISPRKAMLLSLAIPGAAQLRLGRPKSATIFITGELLGFGMLAKSKHDLNVALAVRHDSVPDTYRIDPSTGDTLGVATYKPNRLAARLGARRTHYEDWIAALVFNHLISAADGYVAANLWDFRANVAVEPTRSGAMLAASVTF